MKLGLLSAILANWSFRQVVDLCAEMGFAALEAACWPRQGAKRRYGGVTHLEIGALSPAELERELHYAKDRGVEVSAFAYYPNPLSPVEEEREAAVSHIYRLIEAAGQTGVGLVNTFIGRDRSQSVEENLKRYKEVWSPILEAVEKADVRVAIENCPMFFTQDEWPGGNNLACTPAIWDEMFRLIDSQKLGLNYDPSHCVILDMDYIKPLYQYRDRIFHVHFKDTHIFRDKLDRVGRLAYPLAYMVPKLPGLGDIDWAAFCSALYDIGFTGSACVEVEDKTFEGSDAQILQGIDLARRHIAQFF